MEINLEFEAGLAISYEIRIQPARDFIPLQIASQLRGILYLYFRHKSEIHVSLSADAILTHYARYCTYSGILIVLTF
jgi:hypothetical protein